MSERSGRSGRRQRDTHRRAALLLARAALLLSAAPRRSCARLECDTRVSHPDPSTGGCVRCADGEQVELNVHTGGGACVPCDAGSAGTVGACAACSAGYAPNAEHTACVLCTALGHGWCVARMCTCASVRTIL